MDKLTKLKNIVKESNNIVFFGGAGVSVPSGIPDFRSSSGLYKTYVNLSPEEILSHSYFIKHPKEFYQFYKEKMLYPNVKPNDAHYSLKKLEEIGKLKAIITQNIDNLHQLAGSQNVLELHGNVYRNYCTKCHKSYNLEYILNSKDIPICECGSIIKPDVVLYEEALNYDILEKAINLIEQSQTLIVAGTSLIVNPAASLITYFHGKDLVLINKSPTPYDSYATLVINDSVDKVLKNIVE